MEDNKNVAEVKSGAGSPREAEETPGKSTQNGEIEAQQPLKRSNSAESGGAGHKPPEETPRRRFQIPRKSRDKRGGESPPP